MTSPRVLLAAWNIRAKKQLGQNFLIDPSTASMIVARAGILADDVVLEIGAGLGALTIPLARIAKKVFAVEKDRQLLQLLKTELRVHNISNVILIDKNILRFNINEFALQYSRKPVVMGNLPYSISSQILVQLISSRDNLNRAVLMFQKELAGRLASRAGGKKYGRLTVMLRYCADIKSIARIDADLFFPKPKVDSEVLEIQFKKKQRDIAKDENFLFKVIKAAFGRRRKTLKNSLAGSELEISAATALAALDLAGVDPSRRAETLEVSEFVALSNALAEIVGNNR